MISRPTPCRAAHLGPLSGATLGRRDDPAGPEGWGTSSLAGGVSGLLRTPDAAAPLSLFSELR